MEIDIRDITKETVKTIVFTNGTDDFACKIGYSPDESVEFINCDNLIEGSVEIKDIDNLIKALEKAKELWG